MTQVKFIVVFTSMGLFSKLVHSFFIELSHCFAQNVISSVRPVMIMLGDNYAVLTQLINAVSQTFERQALRD